MASSAGTGDCWFSNAAGKSILPAAVTGRWAGLNRTGIWAIHGDMEYWIGPERYANTTRSCWPVVDG
ncbi:hypothetical protein DSO57_1039159 [Entomophthora muscae]|uniref:Uncharacterized protein n=1 Tax=Entomophthora muscae TaxID=34485 RepID=A0ACC2U991_9FUNG|nr:hypothetical protein DSO57_1039159 [Entomophthora muscae]